MKKSKQVFDYEFKQCSDPSRFELFIEYHANNRLFKYIFNQAKRRVERKSGVVVKGDFDVVSNFGVPKRYFKLIKTLIRKEVMLVFSKCKVDGIEILSHDVEGCKYVKGENGVWNIVVNLTGVMVDKR